MDFNPAPIIREIDDRYGKLKVSDMEDYLGRTLADAAEKYGDDSPGFAALLNELGGFYRALGKYEKAEQAFVRAQAILERTLGANDPNNATTLNNLAGVYRLTGNYAKSEKLFLRSLDIYRNSPFSGSFAHSSVLNNLGLLYQDMGQFEKAAQLHQEAVGMAPADRFGPAVHATSLSNLATAYLGMKRISEAETLLKNAVEIYRQSLGEQDPHYASALNNLGLLYYAKDDHKSAEECYLSALKLREQVYGPYHHEVAKVADNLRALYLESGRLAEAISYAEMSANAYLNILGRSHPVYQNSAAELEKLQKLANKTPSVQHGHNHASPETNRETAVGFGMKLSQQYYNQIGAPMIDRFFNEYRDRIAVGLVGEGSECFGFDDELSRDHDWGPSFCLWLSRSDYEKIGSKLAMEYEKLPRKFSGYEMNVSGEFALERRGVFEIGSFYRKYTGLDRPPASIREWKSIPEINLAIVTNGLVFRDDLKEFTAFRNQLKAFYPEDVRLKKISVRCATMAQAGQYNYMRCVKRSEYVAARHAMAQFIDSGISMAFLLNREYRPFYKWMHRALKPLPILGDTLHGLFLELSAESAGVNTNIYERNSRLIERICSIFIEEIKNQGLSSCHSDFLLDHAYSIRNRIEDPDLKALHVMVE